MIGETVVAIAPALASTAIRQRTIEILPSESLLPILLVLVLVIAGVAWVRRRSRPDRQMPYQRDQWPPRQPERRPNGERDEQPWQ
jgi:hypothetical protein